MYFKFLFYIAIIFTLQGCLLQTKELLVYKKIAMAKDSLGVYKIKVQPDENKPPVNGVMALCIDNSKFEMLTYLENNDVFAVYQGSFIPSKVDNISDFYASSFRKLSTVEYDLNKQLKNEKTQKNALAFYKYKDNNIKIWTHQILSHSEASQNIDKVKDLVEKNYYKSNAKIPLINSIDKKSCKSNFEKLKNKIQQKHEKYATFNIINNEKKDIKQEKKSQTKNGSSSVSKRYVESQLKKFTCKYVNIIKNFEKKIERCHIMGCFIANKYKETKQAIELIDDFPVLKEQLQEIRNIQSLERQKLDLLDEAMIKIFSSYKTTYDGYNSEDIEELLKNAIKYLINEKEIYDLIKPFDKIKPQIIENIKSLDRKYPIKGNLNKICK